MIGVSSPSFAPSVVPVPVKLAEELYGAVFAEAKARGREPEYVIVFDFQGRPEVEVWAMPPPPTQHVRVRDYSDVCGGKKGAVTGWAGNGYPKPLREI